MNYVVDASFLARLLLPDDADPQTDPVVIEIGDSETTAPVLVQLELLNILLVSQRRKRISIEQVTSMLGRADKLSMTLQPGLDRIQRSEILRLAQSHSLTAYDAAYLELAMRLKLPLATLDGKLIDAAKAENVPIALEY